MIPTRGARVGFTLAVLLQFIMFAASSTSLVAVDDNETLASRATLVEGDKMTELYTSRPRWDGRTVQLHDVATLIASILRSDDLQDLPRIKQKKNRGVSEAACFHIGLLPVNAA